MKKARLEKVEDQQNSVTQEFRERFEEFETSILSILQGRDSALKEYMKERLSALEENMEGRFTGMEKKQEGRLSALNSNIEDRLIGMEQKIEGRIHAQVSALEENIRGTLSTMEENMEEKISKMEKKVQQKISKMEKKVQRCIERMVLLTSAILTQTIATPVENIEQISCVKSGRLWVLPDFGSDIYQVNNNGNINEEVHSKGPFCVSKDYALLYKSGRFNEDGHEYDDKYGDRIKKKSLPISFTLLKTEKSEDVVGIYSSFVNGHILVLIQISIETESIWLRHYSHKITRYDENGRKIQNIWISDRIPEWRFSSFEYAYITENKNGDIIISCKGYETVLGMDWSGEHRFLYSHPDNYYPRGICTDKYGHILVAFKSCIHLLDEDGAFQTILLKNVSSNILFTCLCLDDKQNIYVGNDRGIVNVYKYLKDE